ncbi:hypothetical protein AX777_18320 [Sphingobium yanoikuyae]|jgi:hypothetical protein|uniref:Uncharacterized protein n=1 Tax=Sphingobium yanoikuyae TaxID=13690 RepID=A0A177J7P5_SPHYA|nr:hypothetical protein [Sphingobium yanoikuyae]OAH36994.1 hypothetical protein AX777_18320 [Sphingobium yanoikuyae]
MAAINPIIHGTHLMSYTSEHKTWAGMKARCLNPNNKFWPNYGGRGITVCDRWLNSFEAFYEDMGPKPSPKHSIDRIDVNGNYEPGNVRWATDSEQMQNVRHNVRVTFQGDDVVLIEACRRAGIERKYKLIHARITYKGMTFEQAMQMEGISI